MRAAIACVLPLPAPASRSRGASMGKVAARICDASIHCSDSDEDDGDEEGMDDTAAVLMKEEGGEDEGCD